MPSTVTKSKMNIQLSIAAMALIAAVLLASCGEQFSPYETKSLRFTSKPYAFAIIKENIPREIGPGESGSGPVTLINTGSQPWDSREGKPFFLSYHWKHPGGQFSGNMFWGVRTQLPEYVAPGEVITVDMNITALEQAKYYDLTIDIVRGAENIREETEWFEELGWKTHNLRVEVSK